MVYVLLAMLAILRYLKERAFYHSLYSFYACVAASAVVTFLRRACGLRRPPLPSWDEHTYEVASLLHADFAKLTRIVDEVFRPVLSVLSNRVFRPVLSKLSDDFTIMARAVNEVFRPELAVQADVNIFVGAFVEGDDTTALSLLDDDLVTIHSPWTSGPDEPCQGPWTIVSAPVLFERVRTRVCCLALVDLGADIEKFQVSSREGSTATLAGFAIITGKPSVLSLCHRLGTKMSHVSQSDGKAEAISYSAVHLAILTVQPECLKYLLDKVYATGPFDLSARALHDLCLVARLGKLAMPLFKILQGWGYDFTSLAELEDELHGDAATAGGEASTRPGNFGRVTFADTLITSVRASKDAGFLRYVVKNLGLASAAEKVKAVEDLVDSRGTYVQLLMKFSHRLGDDGPGDSLGTAPQGTDLTKYECAACRAVCWTMSCTGCKVTRYCSAGCSRKHWKTGGHKKACKELQRRAAQTSGSTDASSQP